MKLFVLAALVAVTVAAPQGARTASSTPIPILEYQNDFGGDGNYQFRFKTGNEIDREEEGALKEVVVQNDEGQDEVRRVNVVRGVIRYPKEDGSFYEAQLHCRRAGLSAGELRHPDGAVALRDALGPGGDQRRSVAETTEICSGDERRSVEHSRLETLEMHRSSHAPHRPPVLLCRTRMFLTMC
ncbi:uncharacterized protein LOC119103417 [Pollicipes pollicipes]|uniref:uncharacterized protein LOC119103417 n=1 Tax=Pollicipes pollicipes TaxID=41117 RepID=UPI0018850838|nr:uncharacterized protein LOC119103417 [Pollicipes pollicipes]